MAQRIKIGTAVLELTTDNAGVVSGLKMVDAEFEKAKSTLAQKFSAFGSSTSALGKSLSVGLTAPIVGVLGSLSALAVSTAKTGDDIAKAAREAGLGARSYQELSFALGQVAKVSDQELTKGFGKLSTLLADAANGSKPAIAALEKLGFTQAQIASGGITTEQAINAMTAAMQSAASPAQAIALAGDLVGDRLGPKLAGALREGGAQVQSLRDDFNRLNLGMSDEALAASEKFNDQIDVVTRQLGALGREIGAVLVPLLTETLIPAFQAHVIPALQTVSEWVGTAARWFGELPAPVQAGVLAVGALAAAVGPLLVGIGAVASAIGAALPVIATIGGALATLATGPIGIAVAAVVGLGAAWTLWGDDVTRITGEVYTAVKDWLGDKLGAVWSGLQTALETAGGWWTTLKDGAVGAASAILEGVKTSLGTLTRVALLPMTAPIEGVLLAFKHWDEITRIAEQIYLGVKKWMLDQFQTVVDRVKGAVSSVTGAFKSMYDAVVGNSIVPDFTRDVGLEFDKLDGLMRDPTEKATGMVTGLFGGMFNNISEKFKGWGESASTLISEKIGGPLGKAFGTLATDATSLISGIITGGISTLIEFGMQLAIEGLQRLGSVIWDGLKKIGSWFKGVFNFFGSSPDMEQRIIGRRQNPETGEWEPVYGRGVEQDEVERRGGGLGPNESHTTDDADNQGHQRGTPRLDFKPFRWGQRVPLHGMEAVVPRGSGHLLAREIAAAMPTSSGRPVVVNLDMSNAVLPDRASLERFAERIVEPFYQVLQDRRIIT